MAGARPDTWMPWYIGDYQRDTTHLDAEQDGAYRRLIDACWVRHGLLPANDAQLAAITKLTIKRWMAVKPVVAEFFQMAEDGWRHRRVSAELAKAEAFHDARSAGGKRAAKARWSDTLNDSSRIADASLSNAPSPSPSPSHSSLRSEEKELPSGSSKKRGSRLASDFVVPPDWRGKAAAARERNGLPAVNLNLEAEKFVLFWTSKSGRDGAKIDWEKTWINWALNAKSPPGSPAAQALPARLFG